MGEMEPHLRGQCQQLLVMKAMARIILGAVELVIERLISHPLHHIAQIFEGVHPYLLHLHRKPARVRDVSLLQEETTYQASPRGEHPASHRALAPSHHPKVYQIHRTEEDIPKAAITASHHNSGSHERYPETPDRSSKPTSVRAPRTSGHQDAAMSLEAYKYANDLKR